MEDKDIMQNVRNELGYTQTKFAEKLGIYQQTIAMIEHGKRGIPKSAMIALREKFGLSYSDLQKCQNVKDVSELLVRKNLIKVIRTPKKVCPEYKVRMNGNTVGLSKREIITTLMNCFHDLSMVEIEEIK